jgi:hypothetical protein
MSGNSLAPGTDAAGDQMLALTSECRLATGGQGQAETAERRTAMRRQPGIPGGLLAAVCLDAPGSGAAAATTAEIWACDGQSGRQWSLG